MPNTGTPTATPVKLVDGVDANQPPLGTATNPVRVDPTGTTVQPVSVVSGGGGGTQYADGAASGAHPTGTQVVGWNKGATTELGVTARPLTNAQSLDVSIVDGSGNQITSFGGSGGTVNQGTAGTLAGAWPVELSDGTNLLGVSAHPVRTDPTGTTTQPVSGTVTTTPPTHASTNVDQLNGTTVDTNSGLKSAGTLRVVIATDQPALTNAQPVTLPTGQAVGLLDSGGTNKASISAAGAVKVDNSAVTQPVSGTVTANQGGTWTVQPGNTANTTAWKVDGSAVTQPVSGTVTANPTSSTPVIISALTTTQTVIGSAATLNSYYCYNPNASVAYVQIFDISGAVTLGTSVPVWSIGIPASGAANLAGLTLTFANAIKVAATTTAKGSTTVTTGVECNFGYR